MFVFLIVLISKVVSTVNISWVNYADMKFLRQFSASGNALYLHDFGTILGLQNSAPDACIFQQQQIRIRPLFNLFLNPNLARAEFLIDQLTVEQLSKGEEHKIMQVINYKRGILALLTDGTIYYIEQQQVTQIAKLEGLQEPKLVYDAEGNRALVLSKRIAYSVDETTNWILFGWVPTSQSFQVHIQGDRLYQVLSSQGIAVYNITSTQLKWHFQIDSYVLYNDNRTMELTDIILENNTIWVLDRLNGLVQLTNYEVNSQLGLIPIHGVQFFSKLKDTFLLLLVTQQHSILIELLVRNNHYIEIQRTQTRFKQISIQHFEDFVFLNSMHHQLTLPTHIPAQELRLAPPQTHLWGSQHFQKFNETMLVNYKHSALTFYSVIRTSPYLLCTVNESISVDISFNSTKCPLKKQNQTGGDDPLTLCQTDLELYIEYSPPLLTDAVQDEYIMMLFTLGSLVILLLVSMFLQYRRYQIKKEMFINAKRLSDQHKRNPSNQIVEQ